MNGLNDFYIWRRRQEEMLRKARMERLAKASRPPRTGRPLWHLFWELKRHGGQLSKLLRNLRQYTRKENHYE